MSCGRSYTFWGGRGSRTPRTCPEQPQALSHVQSPAGAETGGRTQQGSQNLCTRHPEVAEAKGRSDRCHLAPNPSPKADGLRSSPSCCPWKSFLKNKTNQAGTPKRGCARGPEHPPWCRAEGPGRRGLATSLGRGLCLPLSHLPHPLPSSPLSATRWAERRQS